MRSRCRLLPIAALLLAALVSVAAAQDNVWTTHGPTGVGYVIDLAVGDGVAFAATPNGVFRSRDGGASWAQSGLAGEKVARVLTAPGAAVVLALLVSPFWGEGLYESNDAGETWSQAPGLPAVNLAAIDPAHPSSLYAVTGNGSIWSSRDAGASWHRLSTTPTGNSAQSMAFAANAIYMLSLDNSDQQYKFYRSTDGGVTWPAFQPPSREVSVFGGSASPNVVYAGGHNVFCRSADSAATWSCASAPGYLYSFLELPGVAPGETPLLLAVFAQTVYLSRDGGATWAPAEALGSAGLVGAIASDASGSLVLASISPGILRSQDRGDSWTPGSNGLQASTVSSLALDPDDPSTVWAGCDLLGGLFRSADAGLSWSPAGGPGGPAFADTLTADPENSATLYAADSDDVYRSEDSGAHWTHSTPPTNRIQALAVDPGSPGRVWVAGNAGLFHSEDGARTWGAASITQDVYSLLFDGRRPGTVYAGSYYDVEPGFYGYPEGGSIFVSVDGGANFTKNTQNFASSVTAIALDPLQDKVLYLGTQSTGVFRSADGGVSWKGPPAPPTDFESVLSLVADPVRPGRLYATTDLGVYRTVDSAKTWHPFSSGLGSLTAQPLVVSPDGKWLHLGTNGGGVFELDLETHPCAPTANRLCLVGNRYAVEAYARRGAGPYGLGAANSLDSGSGYFAFPFATGDAQLPEVIVKMFGNGSSGPGGISISYASLTTLPFDITVTDTVTGDVAAYSSDSAQPLCGGTARPFDAAVSSSVERAATAPASDTALALLGSRFSVSLAATDPRTGGPMTARAVQKTDQFGYFSFPELTGAPEFPEVVVKMIDARGLSSGFWVFYGGLTHAAFTLTVTDSVTGAVQTYQSATPFCGAADTRSFAD